MECLQIVFPHLSPFVCHLCKGEIVGSPAITGPNHLPKGSVISGPIIRSDKPLQKIWLRFFCPVCKSAYVVPYIAGMPVSIEKKGDMNGDVVPHPENDNSTRIEIEQTLVASTSHISKETDAALRAIYDKEISKLIEAYHRNEKENIYTYGSFVTSDSGLVFANTGYGWLILVSSDDDIVNARAISEDLGSVIDLARSSRLDYVKLDRDGRVIEFLERFEW